MWDAFKATGGVTDMQKSFYYTDTDSMQIHCSVKCKLPYHPTELGAFSGDLKKDGKVIYGIWIQPKLYMLQYINNENEIHHHFRGAGLPETQLKEGGVADYEGWLRGESRRYSQKFQMKRTVFAKNKRRMVGGVIKSGAAQLCSVHLIKDTDTNENGKRALEKVVGTKPYTGRDFRSNTESYPIGYEN